MIWRRLLVRSDSAITDLHHILQIALGWSDTTSTGSSSMARRSASPAST